MKQLLVGILATIGGMTVLLSGPAFVVDRLVGDGSAAGIVIGPDEKPAVGAAVFLDRGEGAIERYVTDSAGRFDLPVKKTERRRGQVADLRAGRNSVGR